MSSRREFDDLYTREYPRLVRAFSVAFDTESAADAVQEAFIEADR
jgi:DNA-directed RNA polymerase specialized sigma24 family protein